MVKTEEEEVIAVYSYKGQTQNDYGDEGVDEIPFFRIVGDMSLHSISFQDFLCFLSLKF